MSKCKTPGAHYSIVVQNGSRTVGAMISMPYTIDLTNAELRTFKRRLHTALESVLSETFQFNGYSIHCEGRARSEKFMIAIQETPHD